MPRKTRQLAKTSRPRLYSAVPRERLFSLLDECMQHPVTWVSGPPGAGKTTLVAGYLELRRHPALWYQVDAGDADHASFYYYLALAARAWSPNAYRVLPRPRTVQADELAAFTRRFFRQLFSLLPAGAVLALDNYQEVVESPLSVVLRDACLEVPPGQSLVFISRGDPPPQFAELHARNAMVQINYDHLRLKIEETRSICGRRGVREDWIVQALHKQSDGWVAGLTLMLERLRNTGRDARALDTDMLDGVFGYFAGLILERVPEDTRLMLRSLAFLPHFTASAAREVSGLETAGRLLEQLYRRHLFVDRRPGSEPVYQFHALFCGFLQDLALQSLSAQEVRLLIERSAVAAQAAGDDEAAFELYARAQDWSNATRVILGKARGLLDVGRWQTLKQWILSVPSSLVEAEPWLEYWLASAQMQTDPMAAVATFERAQRRFFARNDRAGRVLSLAGLMHACSVDHRGYEIMEGWLDVLAEELASPLPHLASELELQAQGALLWAAFFLRPWHACIVPCLERVEALLADGARASLALGPASSALGVAAQIGDLERAERLAAFVERLSLQPGVSPVDMVWGQFQIAFQRFVAARYEEFLPCLERAWSIAQANSLQNVLEIVLIHRPMVDLRLGNRAAAEATLRQLEALPWPQNPTSQAVLFDYQALREQGRGQPRLAADLAERSYAAAVQSRSLFHEIVFGLISADVLLHARCPERAEPLIARSRELMEKSEPFTNHGAVLALSEAWLAEQQGRREDSLRLLAKGLAVAGRGNGWVRLRFHNATMRHMLSVALQHGIEQDVALQLIRRFRLQPEDVHLEAWPWSIRVHTLGVFEVLLDDVPLEFERKAPKKALALLKLLVALGPRELPEQQAIDALWPDQEGDAAHTAVKITVLRLRRLLRDQDAVRQVGGKLAIDRMRCWVDAWAFEYRVAPARSREWQARSRELDKAVALYRGSFLSQDNDEPWAMATRERLRTKYISAVASLAEGFAAAGRHEEALGWYLKGLDADPIVETFYQGLMRCYHELGRRAEAIDVYRRFKQMLSITLGLKPGAATERLYQSIRAE